MKNIITLMLACLMLSSCGLFKSTFKHKELHSEVSKTSLNSKRDSSGTKLDKSSIRILTANTTVTELPNRVITGKLKTDKQRLQEGVDAIDSAGVKVSVSLDSATNLLRVMVNMPGGKQTSTTNTDEIRNNDISQNSGTSSQQSENRQTAVEDKTKTVQKEPIKMGVLAAIVLGSVAIVSFFIWLYFRIKKP